MIALQRGASVFRVHDVAETAPGAGRGRGGRRRHSAADSAERDGDKTGATMTTSPTTRTTPAEDADDDDVYDDDDEERATRHRRQHRHHRPVGLHAPRRHRRGAEIGQRLLIDVSFELDGCDATVTDAIDDTVDYGAVCEQVWLAAQDRSYKTLERLGSAICDRLMDHFGVDDVMVRCTKPEPPIPLPVGSVSVEVWKER